MLGLPGKMEMADMAGKREAQKRVDRIRAFHGELDELAREGGLVLSPEQRTGMEAHLARVLQDLASHFDVDINESQKQISLGMRIISSLGGLALCAAVFFFFYRFWGGLSTPMQVAVLTAIPVAGLVAMEWAARRERILHYTSLIGLVVLAAFALDLIEFGNIFNIIPSPNGFLAWSLLAFVLAYAYRLRLPLAGGLVALAIYVAARITVAAGYYWAADQMPENYLAVGVAIVAFPFAVRHKRLADFVMVYQAVGLLMVFLSLLLLGNANLSWVPITGKAVQGTYQVAGFIAAGAAIWLGIRNRLPWSVNLGSAFFAIYIFNRMFSWWWDWMPKYIFFLILGAIAVALLAIFRRIRSRIIGVQAA